VFSSLLLLLSAPAHAQWWDAQWSDRATLTFDNSGQAQNLTNFPVLVVLDDATNFDHSAALAAGAAPTRAGAESEGEASSNGSSTVSQEEESEAEADDAYANAQRWRHTTSATLHIEDPLDVDVLLCCRVVTGNYEHDDEPPSQPLCTTCFRRDGLGLLRRLGGQ
jgi:hypothetical protein